jgi:hypothetical protein
VTFPGCRCGCGSGCLRCPSIRVRQYVTLTDARAHGVTACRAQAAETDESGIDSVQRASRYPDAELDYDVDKVEERPEKVAQYEALEKAVDDVAVVVRWCRGVRYSVAL